MKKIFSLFVAVLFVGTVMASETVTYVFSSKSWEASPANWTSGKEGSSFKNNGVQVTKTSTGANATSPVEYMNVSKIEITYNTNTEAGEGTFDVQIGTNSAVSKDCAYDEDWADDGTEGEFVTTFDYASPQSGAIKLTVNCTTNSIYVVSVAITYTYDASAPTINANSVDLGAILIPESQDSYSIDTPIVVTAANLTTEEISVAGSEHVTTTEATLPKAGGTLHMHIEVPVGEFSEVVTLSSGTTTKEIVVSGKIKKNITLPGTALTLTGVTQASNVTVDDVIGVKAGTSTNNGSMSVTVPAGAAVLHFYAAAWAGAGTGKNIGITANKAVLGELSTITLVEDAGLTGNTSSFELDAALPTPYRIDVPLSNVTEATVITLASGTTKRFVVWGATYENATPSALDNAASEQKTVKTIENGQLVIIRDGIRYNALGTRLR